MMEGNNDSQEVVDLKHYRPFFRELDLSNELCCLDVYANNYLLRAFNGGGVC